MSGFIYGRNSDSDTLDGLSSAAFAILAGRAGGQTLNGGTAASETLTLVSTAHGTKGGITLTGSHVILPGSIRPAADSTTALTLCKANGTAVLTVDTTNARMGINVAPGISPLTIHSDNGNEKVLILENVNNYAELLMRAGADGTNNARVQTQLYNPAGTSTYKQMFINDAFNAGSDFFAVTTNPSTYTIASVAFPNGDVSIGNSLTFAEMAAPGAGAANTARIYAVDNGSGKTQLMVQFATGTPIQLSIEA